MLAKIGHFHHAGKSLGATFSFKCIPFVGTTRTKFPLLLAACCLLGVPAFCGNARAQHSDGFNDYVLKAVQQIEQRYPSKGYDIDDYFTHDLSYGGEQIPAKAPPETMCVAAVTEIIIAAIELYTEGDSHNRVYSQLPAQSWRGGNRGDIRPWIFTYDSVPSKGTADALQTFGIGKKISFQNLAPGDFINLNRDPPSHKPSGHAVVFLGFLNKNYGQEQTFSSKVVGFKYFSAQGKGSPDAGLAYRWAFFGDGCPSAKPGMPRDCYVIQSTSQSLLNTGYMLHPDHWTTAAARSALGLQQLQQFYQQNFGLNFSDIKNLGPKHSPVPLISTDNILGRAVPANFRVNYDGVTTD